MWCSSDQINSKPVLADVVTLQPTFQSSGETLNFLSVVRSEKGPILTVGACMLVVYWLMIYNKKNNLCSSEWALSVTIKGTWTFYIIDPCEFCLDPRWIDIKRL